MAKKSNTSTKNLINFVVANNKTKLANVDASSTCGYKADKASTVALLAELNAKLAQLQTVLYAEQKHRVLIVLQAMDTGGKDGVIRKVFSGINPQGVRVVSFKAPTAPELAHDYLWRASARKR
jgi:polyphosphate kinase 2 (PPK2 family)